jgi:hypothetical protein
LDLARKLESLPATSDAFARGAITRAHAQVIARAATPARVDAIAAVEPSLVLAAESVGPNQLRDLVEHATDAIDGDEGAAAADAQHQRRHLHVSLTLDGMVAIDGLLDAEGGELVLSALDVAMEHSRTTADPRTRPQQRADALVELCHVGAPRHAAGPGRRLRPHLTVVVDHDRLVHDRTHTAEHAAERDVTHAPRGHAAHVGRLSTATIERLACDAGIARVVTIGKSMPIDVGRTTRTIPPALWHALVVRDRGCVVPGCDRPPGWCQAHHKVWWTRGGPTNLDNCELRCWQHHRAVHEGGTDPPEP